MESQLATDSSNFVTAQSSVTQYLLQLEVLLNIDPSTAFDIESPSVNQIPVENISELQPEYVYNLAKVNMPQQQVDVLNVKAAQFSVKAAKGQMYPTFSLFGSLGSSYNNKSQQAISKTTVNPPLGKVTVGGTDYDVFPAVALRCVFLWKYYLLRSVESKLPAVSWYKFKRSYFKWRKLTGELAAVKIDISAISIDKRAKQSKFKAGHL